MDDYLAKPIGSDELHRVIHKFATGAGSASGLPSDVLAGTSEQAESEYQGTSGGANGDEATVQLVDWQYLSRMLGRDRGLIRDSLAILRQQCPELLGQLQHAIETHNSSELYHFAHSLKGLSSYLGRSPIVQAAAALELAGMEGNWNNVPELFRGLAQDIARLVELLDDDASLPEFARP